MKILVLGAGAMGMLFGAYLSRKNSVWLVDVNASRVDRINESGVTVIESDGRRNVFRPSAVSDSSELPVMDIVIVFVKAMFTTSALEANKRVIGKDTYVMTLQNGSGHAEKLVKFTAGDRVIIGTTQHNSSVVESSLISHGGSGKTIIGLNHGDSAQLKDIVKNFNCCGIDCNASDNVRHEIWKKLFVNTAASSLTAVLQVPLGYILEDPFACGLMEKLAHEAVETANAEGMGFDEDSVINSVKELLERSKGGYTSIYSDIAAGRSTEVDTISGSVISAAAEHGISVPYHETIVALIHALESKTKSTKGV